MAAWAQKLNALGLTSDEEGKARHLLRHLSDDDREFYLADPPETARVAIRELLKEGVCGAMAARAALLRCSNTVLHAGACRSGCVPRNRCSVTCQVPVWELHWALLNCSFNEPNACS